MPLPGSPPDPLSRPVADRSSIFADAGRTSYAAAKGVSDIDSLLAENKHAVQGKSILDRVFPISSLDNALYEHAEHLAGYDSSSGHLDLSDIGPEEVGDELRHMAGTPHDRNVEGAPDRLDDPYDLHSPWGANEQRAYRMLSTTPTSNNIDAVNMHREAGVAPFSRIDLDEAADYGQDMLAMHSSANAFDPSTLHKDMATPSRQASASGRVTFGRLADLRLSGIHRDIHQRLMDEPELVGKFASPQFAGSLMDLNQTQERQMELHKADIDPEAVWTEHHPGHTGDVYVQHDPTLGTTRATVKHSGSGRELYHMDITGRGANRVRRRYPEVPDRD